MWVSNINFTRDRYRNNMVSVPWKSYNVCQCMNMFWEAWKLLYWLIFEMVKDCIRWNSWNNQRLVVNAFVKSRENLKTTILKKETRRIYHIPKADTHFQQQKKQCQQENTNRCSKSWFYFLFWIDYWIQKLRGNAITLSTKQVFEKLIDTSIGCEIDWRVNKHG